MHSLVELYVLPSLNKELEKSMHPIVEVYVAPSFFKEQQKSMFSTAVLYVNVAPNFYRDLRTAPNINQKSRTVNIDLKPVRAWQSPMPHGRQLSSHLKE